MEKHIKKIIISLCVTLLMGFMFIPKVTLGAEKNIFYQEEGYLNESEKKSYNFELPKKSKVTITFDESTYGDYLLKIKDESGNIVFEHYDYIPGSLDTKITTNLKKGKYTLILQENDEFYFKYIFKMTYAPLKNISTKTLELNKNKLSLKTEQTYKLKPQYTPSDSNDGIYWNSSNKKIATINGNGEITTKNLGETTITAKMGTKKAKCVVTVSNTDVEIVKGKTQSLTNILKNIDGYKKATWKSNKESIVTVSKNGKIKAIKHGKAKVTAKISKKTYSFTIYVYDNEVLKKETETLLKSMLKNPNSLIINDIYETDNHVEVDYSAMNGFGGYNREKITTYYNKGVLKYY